MALHARLIGHRGRSIAEQLVKVCNVSCVVLHLNTTGCNETPTPPHPNRARPSRPPTSPPPSTAASTAPLATEDRHWSPKPETLEAVAKVVGKAWRPSPQSLTPQRMTFFARNFAVLLGDSVLTLPLLKDQYPNPCRANRIAVDTPRELGTLPDQTLLVIGAKLTLNVDSNCKTTQTLGKVTYLPGARLLADARWTKTFALFDAASGNISRFRWPEAHPTLGDFMLPVLTNDDPNLKNAACALMRDGSLACVNGIRLFTGWPGMPTRLLGVIPSGAPIVRLLPGDRIDHVRVLRDDSQLEEYWLIPKLPRTRSFTLPEVAFDVAAGSAYLAVLQLEGTKAGTTDVRLVILETDGTLRWSRSLDHLPPNLSEQQRLHDYFDCRGLATHPTRPLVAVSNCDRVELFDAKSGQRVQDIDRTAP